MNEKNVKKDLKMAILKSIDQKYLQEWSSKSRFEPVPKWFFHSIHFFFLNN